MLVFRGDRAKDAELLVLRHENAALRLQASRVRYEPADRPWFAALAPFIPWRQRARIFPVTPATLLAWQRRLVARKYDTSTRRQAWPSARGPEYRPDRRPPGERESAEGLPADAKGRSRAVAPGGEIASSRRHEKSPGDVSAALASASILSYRSPEQLLAK